MRLKAIADHNRVVRLEDWNGLDLTGANSSKTQLQAAIVESETEQLPLILPAGIIVVDGAGVTCSDPAGITLRGAGMKHTVIRHAPTANGQVCMTFAAAPAADWRESEVSGFQIDTLDSTYNKTAMYVVGAAHGDFERIYVRNFYGGNTDSVGLHYQGHETCSFRHMKVQGVVPVRISKNTISGHQELTADILHFESLMMLGGLASAGSHMPATLTSACVLVDEDVYFSNTVFDGASAAVGCEHGFYYKQDAGNLPISIGSQLRIENMRHEQGLNTNKHSFHIECTDTRRIQNVKLGNIKTNRLSHGVYLRHLDSVTVTASHFGNDYTTNTRYAIDADYVYDLNMPSNYFISTAALNIGSTMQLLSSGPRRATYNVPFSNHYAYAPSSTYSQRPTQVMNGVHKWSWRGTLGNNAQVQLPINDVSNIGVAEVRAVAYSSGGTTNKHGHGTWALAPSAIGTNGVALVSGVNATEATTVDSLCCYSAATGLDAPVYVQNRFGADAYVVVEVTYYQTSNP